MTNYYIKLSYDGKYYFGFAIQPNVKTIQSELQKYLGGKIITSGRTDRYVHAKNQIVSLTVPQKLSKAEIYKRIIKLHNNTKGIKIKTFKRALDNWNPRYSAKEKIYEYVVDTKKYGIDDYVYGYGLSINLPKIREASKLFVGKQNLASFTSKVDYPSYVKTINYIKIKKSFGKVKFLISAPGFMRFQVRNIVGVLIAYADGRISISELKDLFDNPTKGKAHYKAPGSGLYLKKVIYNRKNI